MIMKKMATMLTGASVNQLQREDVARPVARPGRGFSGSERRPDN